MILITHPDNVKPILDALNNEPTQANVEWPTITAVRLARERIRIQTSTLLERYKWSGRYLLKNGEELGLGEGNPFFKFRLHERFITYTQDDLGYMLYVGLVRKEMEMVIYTMADNAFSSVFDPLPLQFTPPKIDNNPIYSPPFVYKPAPFIKFGVY